MKRFAVIAIIISVIFSVCACSGYADDSEIIGALGELLPKSKYLYSAVYGDILEHGLPDDTGYCLVEDEELTSISQIKEALYTVFTPEYADIICNTAFRGVQTDDGYISAKFMEREGKLYVNPSTTEDFATPRDFDISSASVKEKNLYMAKVEISHNGTVIEVILQYMDGKWLIDSPVF